MKNSIKTSIVILGTHSLALEVADLIDDVPDLQLAGFVENWDRARCEKPLANLPVFWVDELGELAKSHVAVCAFGTSKRSGFIETASQAGMQFIAVAHPTARVSTKSTLGAGCIVNAGAIIGAHSSIGVHTIVNRGALVGHHTHIGELVNIGPGANIAGMCHVGDKTLIGMSAVVLDHLTIGEGAVVGSGAVVTRNVAARTQVLGVPARVVKENIEPK